MSDKNITLIGAGLVGSLLAVYLARRGFNVEIFERRPDMRKENISAGRSINLALANRGIYPLQQAGLMDHVSPMLTPMKGRMIHDKSGNQSLQPYGQRPEEVIYSVSRADLNKLCMTQAEQLGNVSIRFNQRCESIDFDNNELLLVDEENGNQYRHTFTRVIGTDGSASAIRESIQQKQNGKNSVEPLDHSYKELCIPPSPNGDFQMEPNALHIWPRGGYMVIALPNIDGSFTVTLFMPNEGPVSFESIKDKTSLETFFAEQFPDAKALLPDLEYDYFNNPTGRLATVRTSPWYYQDKALLLGDAAHAIVPFHGQGMNCGFEDVWDFDQCIEQFGDDWQQVFAETEKRRIDNGNAIADMALENYIEMRDSVNDARYLLKKQLSFELEKRWPNHFIPRYSMVMFHRLPYSEAFQRGKIQNRILDELTENITDIKQCDMEKAQHLIMRKLPEIIS
ncbi:NAD(P)/FAD-dependent oxidoreductase [Pleionea sp. CnH1-48]|uniref:FAD-dependent oxidoreductase n=1 Tax=Pleionea sp. CnH1-48 TaxID=2954494 RepID=UPI0020977968|nr:NAD(P)/FAD-dependent oxidoreductase [Pleionea sp. CnH1-48]MCO7227341.1 FAD-dependent monooxygenase [Pleionea sp. CnH1-48]